MTTWNAADKSANISLTNGNLTAQATSATDGGVRSSTFKSSGSKTYFEIKFSAWAGSNTGCGLATSAMNLGTIGSTSVGLLIYQSGNIWLQGSQVAGAISLGSIAAGDTIGFAIDLVNSRAWLRKNNGNWNNSGTANPTTNVGGINISGVWPGSNAYSVACFNSTTPTSIVTFSTAGFAFPAPSGFAAWDAIAILGQTAVAINTG